MQQHTHSRGGQMMQQGTTQGGQQMMQTGSMRLQDVETVQQRNAVEQINRAIQICGFCAEQCIEKGDPHMAECIRRCEDVAELGETALAMIPRNSRYATTVLQAFQQAAEDCAQECSNHQDAHCQDCAQMLPGAAQAVQQYLQFQ